LNKTASNRSFGLLLFAICVVLAATAAWRGRSPVVWGGLAGVFLLIAILIPRVLAPGKRLWFKLAAWMGVVTGPLALGLMYVIVVVPIGLLVRVFGKDLLSLKLDSSATSYWVTRKAGGPAPDSLKEPY
jgi:hypothetical protein